MQNSKTKVNDELLGIDQALHRAAANAKLQAERQGTPYVICRDSNNGKFLENKQENVKSK